MIVSLAALILTGYTQKGLDAHITLEMRAARAPVVLKELSRITRFEIKASPDFENEVLLVSAKNVKTADLLSRIATVTGGVWKPEGSAIRLVVEKPKSTKLASKTKWSPFDAGDNLRGSLPFSELGPLVDYLKTADREQWTASGRPPSLRPNDVDPLAYIATDELLDYQRKLGKPMIADIPDGWAFPRVLPSYPGKPDYESVQHSLRRGVDLAVVPDRNFIVLKPTHPADVRSERMNRSAMQMLLAKIPQKNVPSLDDLSQFAMHSRIPSLDDLTSFYLWYFARFSFQEFRRLSADTEMLRLYGLLTEAQKAVLTRGGALKVVDLAPAQKYHLELVVDGHLSADAEIRLTTNQKPVVLPLASDRSAPYGGGRVEDADDMAQWARIEKHPVEAVIPHDPDQQYLVGEQTELRFAIFEHGSRRIEQVLFDDRFPSNSAIVGDADLPKEIQDRIAKELAETTNGIRPIGR